MRKAYLLILALFLLVFSGCGTAPTSAPSPAPAETTKPVAAPTEKPTAAQTSGTAPAWKADGVVSEGEYAHETTIGDVHLWWRNDAQYLYVAFEAKTNGWVAVGLDPERRMKGASYLIGMISDGQATVVDAYGTAETGATHPADEDLGGKNDIAAFAGVQEGAVTRFEVQIPLDSGDKYDKPLKPGETYAVITAASRSAQFNAPHSSRSSGQVALDAAQ